MKKTTLAYLIVSVLLFAQCNTKRNAAVEEAIAALQKVQAATQVGVNYQNYGQLVIEAKAQVNKANSLLSDSGLKTELNQAMDAYADAALAWSFKFQPEARSLAPYLFPNIEPGKTLIPKYSLPITDKDLNTIKVDEALQFIWVTADSHIAKANSLK